ncbi:MAG: hypothetical protein SGJ19_12870 [Planctomycetia bacterium]|nr:hypothetical protein [Planctomycetia bacterium]
MIASPAFPRDVIVDICTVFKRSPAVVSPANTAEWDDEDGDGHDGEDIEMPFPEEDPDWGFEEEEAQPEQGDFWLDSDDDEDAL